MPVSAEMTVAACSEKGVQAEMASQRRKGDRKKRKGGRGDRGLCALGQEQATMFEFSYLLLLVHFKSSEHEPMKKTKVQDQEGEEGNK